jgi:cell division protein FtsL
MNAAARALEQSAFDISHVQSIIFSKRHLMMMLLIFAVLATAFSVVSVKDQNRRLVSEFSSLEKTRDELNMQWSQLLLEQNTWSAQARVQHIAQNNLAMGVPAVRHSVRHVSQKNIVIRR